ncbi:aromatic amino acid lyase [Streptomyces sp. NPDC048825]|uniref:aromatic amino acid lyase n=1 Tax=Streptomyces sp. NPDC048825 TaxID=3365592 RepID=UPI0037149A56
MAVLERTDLTGTGSGRASARPAASGEGPAAEGPAAAASLDGRGLDAATVAGIADGAPPPAVDPAALEAMERSGQAACVLAAEGGRVYGRSTGVGAHRGATVEERDGYGHDLRLLLSHAGGIGELLPVRQVRAMMLVRAGQLPPRG